MAREADNQKYMYVCAFTQRAQHNLHGWIFAGIQGRKGVGRTCSCGEGSQLSQQCREPM